MSSIALVCSPDWRNADLTQLAWADMSGQHNNSRQPSQECGVCAHVNVYLHPQSWVDYTPQFIS
jgi:hypothetical protein